MQALSERMGTQRSLAKLHRTFILAGLATLSALKMFPQAGIQAVVHQKELLQGTPQFTRPPPPTASLSVGAARTHMLDRSRGLRIPIPHGPIPSLRPDRRHLLEEGESTQEEGDSTAPTCIQPVADETFLNFSAAVMTRSNLGGFSDASLPPSLLLGNVGSDRGTNRQL